MINHEIRCDVCDDRVAVFEPGLFRRKKVVLKKYLSCKLNMYGREKHEAHICMDCMRGILNKIQKGGKVNK